jgi:Na+/proline symporter
LACDDSVIAVITHQSDGYFMELESITTLDWGIVAGSIILMTAICVSLSRFMQGVADFLAANRSAGRYLLTIAGGMSGVGAISVVALLEAYATAGFPPLWWQLVRYPVTIVLILSGWVYYPTFPIWVSPRTDPGSECFLF